MTSKACQDKVKRWVTADFVNVSRRVSVNCNSTFCSVAYLDYSVDSASLNNSEELLSTANVCATAAIFEVFVLNLQFSKWRKISKIGLLQECCVLQIQKIPKKLIGRKSKPSLNMAQEISWSVSLRTAGIFGSFVWSTNESILEQL